MTDGQTVMGRLEQLVRIYLSRGFTEDLRPSQWQALRFFAQAAPEERSLTAFAKARAKTLGTASITVSGLVEKGLMTRAQSGRNVGLEVSPRGLELLQRSDPYRSFEHVLERLPPEHKQALIVAVDRIVSQECGA